MVENVSFDECLAFSKERAPTDIETIRQMIPGCSGVEPQPKQIDKLGVDFKARLKSGLALNIDVKTRRKGCGKYWVDEKPEMSIERWSREKTPERAGELGWTLDDRKHTDLILQTFDRADSHCCWLLSFPLLRAAYLKHGQGWLNCYGPYRHKTTNHQYATAYLLVPVWVVINAIRDVSQGVYAGARGNGAGGAQ